MQNYKQFEVEIEAGILDLPSLHGKQLNEPYIRNYDVIM